MHILPVSEAAIVEALEVLARGGCIAHATETCYGFAVDLTNPDAVARLFAIKQRPLDQPVSALFASVEEARKYVEWNPLAEEFAKKHLPGPLTLVLRMRLDAPHVLFTTASNEQQATLRQRSGQASKEQGTIGIRVSSHPIAHELAHRFGRPLSTTSANLHGQPNTYNVRDIEIQLTAHSSQLTAFSVLLLDSGPLPQTPPSTVIDCTGKTTKTLRG